MIMLCHFGERRRQILMLVTCDRPKTKVDGIQRQNASSNALGLLLLNHLLSQRFFESHLVNRNMLLAFFCQRMLQSMQVFLTASQGDMTLWMRVLCAALSRC